MNVRLNRSLPLTVTLPLFVAVAVFVIAVGTTQIGVRFLQSNFESALRDQAVVFLDAVAGHIAGEIDAGPQAVNDQLAASLAYRTTLLEESMAARWTMADGEVSTVVLGENHRDILTVALDTARAIPVDAVHVRSYSELAVFLVLRTYSLDEGTRLALAATFDASSLVESANWASNVALGIDVFVAILAALAVYAVTRRALAPLDQFTRRLADREGRSFLSGRSPGGNELRRLEAALVLRERSEAERLKVLEGVAQQERDALLARMAAGIAHEVRNPLAGLKNGVSTLKRYGDRPEIRAQTLDIIDRGLDSIGRVVDVALSTYRRRTGDARLSAADIGDLGVLLKPDAERAGVFLEWDLDKRIELFTDADGFRQILINLLLNAIRASPPGGTVTVSLGRDEKGEAAYVTITDQGPGMPPEIVAAIVSGQVENLPVERSLGIWMVAKLVEQMGATLSIRSAEGTGTAVRIEIPQKTPIAGSGARSTADVG